MYSCYAGHRKWVSVQNPRKAKVFQYVWVVSHSSVGLRFAFRGAGGPKPR